MIVNSRSVRNLQLQKTKYAINLLLAMPDDDAMLLGYVRKLGQIASSMINMQEAPIYELMLRNTKQSTMGFERVGNWPRIKSLPEIYQAEHKSTSYRKIGEIEAQGRSPIVYVSWYIRN